MKKLAGISILLLVVVLTMALTTATTQTSQSLEGTWELVNRFNYEDERISDTIVNTNGYRQVKIYSKGKVMWTRYSPDDPAEWFGFGSYKNTQDELEERLEYGSGAMMQIVDTVQVFKFELELFGDSYSQITLDEDGNRTFSENYRRID